MAAGTLPGEETSQKRGTQPRRPVPKPEPWVSGQVREISRRGSVPEDIMEEFDEFVEGIKKVLREILAKDEEAFVMVAHDPRRLLLGWVICTSDPERIHAAHPVIKAQICHAAAKRGSAIASLLLHGDMNAFPIMSARMFLRRLEVYGT